MNSNIKHNNSLNEPGVGKQHMDSPMPKIFTPHTGSSIALPTRNETTPPPDAIQEEKFSNEEENFSPEELVPNYEKCLAKTPVALFRNIDYTGMSREEIISRSARRVLVKENGEEVPDLTWTEFKMKIMKEVENLKKKKDLKKEKTNEASEIEKKDTDESDENDQSDLEKSVKKVSLKEEKKIGKTLFTSEKKKPSQDSDMKLRRSQRLAKVKNNGVEKRKATPGKYSSKKKTPRHDL